jgi:hypothetical protein
MIVVMRLQKQRKKMFRLGVFLSPNPQRDRLLQATISTLDEY